MPVTRKKKIFKPAAADPKAEGESADATETSIDDESVDDSTTDKEEEKQAETIDEQAETVEEQAETIDEQAETVEEQAETIDEQAETEEEQAETVEEQAETVEEKAETVEEKAEAVVEKAETAEKQAETVEEKAETVVEKAETADKQAETVEKQAEDELGTSVTIKIELTEKVEKPGSEPKTVEDAATGVKIQTRSEADDATAQQETPAEVDNEEGGQTDKAADMEKEAAGEIKIETPSEAEDAKAKQTEAMEVDNDGGDDGQTDKKADMEEAAPAEEKADAEMGEEKPGDKEGDVVMQEEGQAASKGVPKPVPPVDDDVIIVEDNDDEEEKIQIPESFSKLHQLTVNIGPIKQRDLMSKELHSILNLTWNFEIKFEKKDRVQDNGITKSERPGYVRIPFLVKSPKFLVTIAKKLGNLRIDGRDMSVKFPDAFNAAVKDCEEYVEKVGKRIAKQKLKKVEMMKRQILVKNVPDKVEEETIKSMFPEACDVKMNMVTAEDGTKTVRSVLLDFETEKACLEFLESNKDVQIGDCKVRLTRLFVGDTRRAGRRPNRGRGAGANRGRGTGPGKGAGAQQFPNNKAQFGQGRGRGRGMPDAARGRGGQNMRRGNQGGRQRGNSGRGKQMQSPGAQSRAFQSPHQQNRNMQSPGRNMQSPGRSQGGRPSLSPQMGPARGGGNQGNRPFKSQGQQRAAKPYPDRGSLMSNQQQRQANQAFAMRDQHTAGRGGRMQQQRGGGMQQPSGSRGGGGDEDPMAMMAYLKSTLARMEEKISHSTDYDYGGGHQGSYLGVGADNRKRKASRSEPEFGTKRPYGQDTRFSDRETAYNTGYNTNRAASRGFDEYDDRSQRRGYGDTTTSYQDNKDDFYRDNRYDNTRQTQYMSEAQGQRNLIDQRSFGAQRNVGAQRNMGAQRNVGGQMGYGNQGASTYSGNRW